MRSKGVVMVLTTGVLWGVMSFFFRRMSACGLNPTEIIFIRMLTALVVLGLFLFIKDKKLFRFRWKDLWFLIGGGVFCLFGFNFFYYCSLQYSTIAVCVSILYTAPAFSLIFSALILKEKITLNKTAALIMIVLGCFMSAGFFSGEQYLSMRGFLCAITAAAMYGIFSVFGHFAAKAGYSAYTTTFYNLLFCVLLSLFVTDFSAIRDAWCGEVCFYGICIAIPCSVFPYILFNEGVKHLESGEATMLTSSEPVTGSLISVFVFHEPINAFIIIGLLLIIKGICVMNLRSAGKGKNLFKREKPA